MKKLIRLARQRGGLSARSVGILAEARAASWFFTRPKYEPTHRVVVLGSGARCGSTVLSELMGSLPEVTGYGEILNDRTIFPFQKIQRYCAITPTDVFLFKVLPRQLPGNPTESLRLLADLGYKFIYVRRGNLLRQAISWVHSSVTEEFHVTDRNVQPKITMDVQRLLEQLATCEYLRDLTDGFVREVAHVRIDYESDLESSDAHNGTVRRITDFLGIPFSPPQTKLKRRLPGPLGNVLRNFNEIEAAVRQTKFGAYFDE